MKKCVLSIIALLTVNTAAIAQSVKCPDNRHPHMVDLVLPSGTKWACCNLGAGNPNQLGSKYRWGETHAAQNNEDDLEKYKFYDSKNNKYANIGENISGTKYDAAHVKTAGKWRMPTKRETKELITNCKREIKVLSNNKMVYVFYGKNGKAIFIPIDGIKFDDGEWVPDLTHYWTATLKNENGYSGESENLWIGPNEMDGDNDYHIVEGWSRERPCYIRPVCK